MSPDLLVAWGPRSLLALSGIVTLVAGVWHVDRTWDEKGSKAYARAAKDVGKAGDSKEEEATVTIPQKDLDAAFPFPWAFLLGWALYATSYLFPVGGGSEVELTSSGALAALFSLALGGIASVPMGDAVQKRDAAKKQKLSGAFVLSWLGLTITTGLSSGNGGVSFACCGLGAVSIIASMKILWKHRKMGDSWEQHGKPNPNPVVYNMGGPLFVFGWFLFWVGMTATTTATEGVSGLPIYLTARTALAFFAGCGMVPVVMMADYAHDEGASYVGYGTDGRFFGRFLESPIPFVTMWALFGVASFLCESAGEDGTALRQWVILANCVLQGVDAGVLIQTALYEGDMARKNKWSVPFVGLFLALAINLGLTGAQVLALALPGAVLVIAGQKTVFGDRKRGDYFMTKHAENPNPIVYSVGEPLFMAGWILLSLAMSMPM